MEQVSESSLNKPEAIFYQGEVSEVNKELKDVKREYRRTNYFWGILVIFILLLFGGASFYLVRQTTYIFPRASTPRDSQGAIVSLENSYVFASPVRAASGGEKIRITAFILDEKGLGISGRQVNLGNTSSLVVSNIQELTDDTGKAFFDVSATTPGVYLLEAVSGSYALPQRVRITFD